MMSTQELKASLSIRSYHKHWVTDLIVLGYPEMALHSLNLIALIQGSRAGDIRSIPL